VRLIGRNVKILDGIDRICIAEGGIFSLGLVVIGDYGYFCTPGA